jgi:hypothetical protein
METIRFRDRGRGISDGVETKLRNRECDCLIKGIGLHFHSVSNAFRVTERDSASGHGTYYISIFAFCSPMERPRYIGTP